MDNKSKVQSKQTFRCTLSHHHPSQNYLAIISIITTDVNKMDRGHVKQTIILIYKHLSRKATVQIIYFPKSISWDINQRICLASYCYKFKVFPLTKTVFFRKITEQHKEGLHIQSVTRLWWSDSHNGKAILSGLWLLRTEQQRWETCRENLTYKNLQNERVQKLKD